MKPNNLIKRPINTDDWLMNPILASEEKATKALQFYEDCVDHIAYCEAYGKEINFNWDICRAYCRVGKTYSQAKFMEYLAKWFGVTVSEMKLQWRNIEYSSFREIPIK